MDDPARLRQDQASVDAEARGQRLGQQQQIEHAAQQHAALAFS